MDLYYFTSKVNSQSYIVLYSSTYADCLKGLNQLVFVIIEIKPNNKETSFDWALQEAMASGT